MLGMIRIHVAPQERGNMKQHVKRFKSLKDGSKEIEKFVRRARGGSQ